jgi:hypothetical protein
LTNVSEINSSLLEQDAKQVKDYKFQRKSKKRFADEISITGEFNGRQNR